MFGFFTYITHAVATLVVSVLITTGLATVPAVTTNHTLTEQAPTNSNVVIASTTEKTSVVTPPKTNSEISYIQTQTISPNIPVVTGGASPSNSASPTIVTTNTTTAQPVTITIKPDTVGIVSTGLEAFYNIGSDSAAETDLKTIEVSISGVQVASGMVVSINDDTDNQLLMASSQGTAYDANTHTLNITATLNRPLRILSGYPTMFDIKATSVSPVVDNPKITVISVGSNYILNAGGSVLLQNTLDSDTETAAVNYYLANQTCAGLQGNEYSDCLSYALNH